MRQRRLKNEINVVPYIDVMLVLLIIFMVTAPMMQAGNIDVPTAGELPAPPAEAAIVQIDKYGKLSIKRTSADKERPLDLAEFQIELKSLVAADRPILIAADGTLQYQRVIDVLDEAREAGATKISLQTKSARAGK